MSFLALLAFWQKWKYEILLAILLGLVGYACWHLKQDVDEAKAARIQLANVQEQAAAEAAQAQAASRQNQAAIAQLQHVRVLSDQTVLARDNIIKSIASQRRVTDEKIRVVYEKPDVKKWADEPVPGDVIGVLRNYAPSAGAQTADNRASAEGDASAGADRGDSGAIVSGAAQ